MYNRVKIIFVKFFFFFFTQEQNLSRVFKDLVLLIILFHRALCNDQKNNMRQIP